MSNTGKELWKQQEEKYLLIRLADIFTKISRWLRLKTIQDRKSHSQSHENKHTHTQIEMNEDCV